MRRLRYLLGACAAMLGLAQPAQADTPVALYQSIAGNVNFTGTVATMRTGRTVCETYSAKTKLSKTLAGIPAGATVLSARLYWAGSSSTPDYQVTFENKSITAQRQFTSATTGYTYFGAVADVTTIVKAKGNGTYTFSNLSVNSGRPYCAVEGVLGGFALLVVYQDAAQPFRVLNVYEGFQYFRYSSLSLSLSNFQVPNPVGSASGRLGHITWEGDLSLNQNGENLSFNGTIMKDAMNAEGNQFNSQSNINGDKLSYGIDFDAYNVVEPLIQPGQTSATTVYSSGQDLVLLTAEIVAVPNVPVADLSISMTRTGEAYVGQNVTYTLAVKNNGPNAAAGPITVTDSLPGGTAFVSASGTSWTCTTSGQTVTCTYAGSVAVGQALPSITIVARVSTSGLTYTNNATVGGTTFDNVNANNTATDTATDPSLSGVSYVFTLDACADGETVGSATCRLFSGSIDAGSSNSLYITALNPADPGKAKAVSNNNSNKSLSFSLTCSDPKQNAGVQAVFGGVQMPLCYPNGAVAPAGNSAWMGPYTIAFTGKEPSAGPYAFQYKDVGAILLNVQEKAGSTYYYGRAQVVSQPASLKLDVTRPSDGLVNPGNATDGFVAAGDPFTVVVTARNTDGTPTPNFGKEVVPEDVKLEFVPSGAAGLLEGSFGAASAGAYNGSFTYTEGGTILLSAGMNSATGDYLGSARKVGNAPLTVGWFYPAYFGTAPTAAFVCQSRMACPSGATANGDDLGVSGGVYSLQPFDVAVTAYSAKDTEMANYTPTATYPLKLTAYTLPGQSGVALASTAGVLSNASGSTTLAMRPTFTLPTPYASTAPVGTMNWTAPTTIYLRAEATVKLAGSPSTKGVSSLRPLGKKSLEGGVRVVNGRLFVANSAGSELLRLPVRLNAQYWTGNSWDNNPDDDDSTITSSSVKDPTFTNCRRTICNTTIREVEWPAFNLVDGVGKIWLQAPGTGFTGSIDLSLPGSPAWLPSTLGRAVFGVYRSPLIYIREVY